MHDVFHASLLRVHVPNDDRLFPGRMDTQLSVSDDSEGEWAVDKILSHSGSGENALFEVEWKASDKTWLPYYQISHLNALPVYLDLLEVSNVTSLPRGHGTPPEDPQIFAGNIQFISPILQSDKYYCRPPSSLIFTAQRVLSHVPRSNSRFYHSLTMSDAAAAKPAPAANTATPVKTVNPSKDKIPKKTYPFFPHEFIRRTAHNTIHIDDLGTIHLGQLALYCATDALIRKVKIPEVYPVGYEQFAATFNDFVDNDQPYRFATHDATLGTFHTTGIPPTIHDFKLSEDDVSWTYRPPKSLKRSAPNDVAPHADTTNPPTASSSNPGAAVAAQLIGTAVDPGQAHVLSGLLWSAAAHVVRQDERRVESSLAKANNKRARTIENSHSSSSSASTSRRGKPSKRSAASSNAMDVTD